MILHIVTSALANAKARKDGKQPLLYYVALHTDSVEQLEREVGDGFSLHPATDYTAPLLKSVESMLADLQNNLPKCIKAKVNVVGFLNGNLVISSYGFPPKTAMVHESIADLLDKKACFSAEIFKERVPDATP